MRKYIIVLLLIVFTFGDTGGMMALPLFDRALLYQFHHANIFHLLVNCLSVWLVFDPKRKDNKRVLFYSLNCSILVYFLPATRPILGFSNVLFCACGMRTPDFHHPWWRSSQFLLFLAIMFLSLLLPQISALTHVVSFVIGVILANIHRYVLRVRKDAERAMGHR